MDYSWLVFAIISLTSAGFSGVVHRYILREHDWLSYIFVHGVLTTLFFIPLVLFNFSLPTSSFSFFIIFIGIGLWTLIAITTAKSFQLVEASERSPIKQTQIIFLLILSYFFLSEVLTFNKVMGSLLIFGGVVLISYKKGAKFNFDKGFQMTILTAFFTAIVSLVDKTALNYWNPSTYSFFMYLFPAIVFSWTLMKRKDKLITLLKARPFILIIAAFLEFAYFYSKIMAYSLADVSTVFPILRLSILVTVAGGIVLLKERRNILQKAFSAIIMLIGAIIVAG